MEFAEKVKFVRTKLKLSQEDLAHELGVSFATINRWENGSYNPSRLAKKAFEDYCERKNIKEEDNWLWKLKVVTYMSWQTPLSQNM